MVKIAVLDDYLGIVGDVADWSVLPPHAELSIFSDHLSDEGAIASRLSEFDIVVAMRERTPFPGSLLERLPKLALLVTLGMANRSIDLERATELGIAVSGTRASGPDPVELTWGLILALARNIPLEDRAIRDGRWQTRVGARLAGRTLGVVGLGRLGAQVAHIGTAFQMSVIAWSQNLTPERAKSCGAELVTREQLFSRSDVVSVHLRLSERTRGLIGPGELALMKPTAYLINTARSQLIDAAALVECLRRRAIAGAGLDVFDEEPLPADHPLLRMENTVMTPHLGGVTAERYRADYGLVIEDILSYLDGKPLRILNPSVLERSDVRQPG